MEVKPEYRSVDGVLIEPGKQAYYLYIDHDVRIDEYTVKEIIYATGNVKIVQNLPADNENFTGEKIKFVPHTQIYMDLQGMLDSVIRNYIYHRDIVIPDKLAAIKNIYDSRFGYCNLNDDKFQVQKISSEIKI